MKHFKKLNEINVNEHTEKKQNLTYLSWAWAWAETKKQYPNAQYNIIRFDGLPYIYDDNTGYMVYTTVTIEDLTHEMWLPVMDGANKAMKNKAYKYTVRNGDKTCEAASMTDINKTIMRCLTKNLAMFGLGLYIYAGEDMPDIKEELKPLIKFKEGTKEILPFYNEVIKWAKSNNLDANGLKNYYVISDELAKEIEHDLK